MYETTEKHTLCSELTSLLRCTGSVAHSILVFSVKWEQWTVIISFSVIKVAIALFLRMRSLSH